jgi:hypothetical protein
MIRMSAALENPRTIEMDGLVGGSHGPLPDVGSRMFRRALKH